MEKPHTHFAWVDLLRGLAALGVVLFHARVDLWVGWREITAHPERYGLFDRAIALLNLPVACFGSGVMLFFLVSGFCIHYPCAGGRDCRWRAYGLRRLVRIYPPYLGAVLVACGVEALLLLHWGWATSPLTKVFWTLAMIQNYGPELRLGAADGAQVYSNPALWTLPVEMEFYLLYPCVYWLLRHQGTGRTLALAGLVSGLAAALLLLGCDWTMGNFAKYWVIWCAGAVLAEWTRRGELPRWNGLLWLATGLCFALAVTSYWLLPVGLQHFLWAAAYFLLFAWGLGSLDLHKRLAHPAVRPLLGLGAISYSLYLLHYPLFKLMGAVWLAHFGSKPGSLLVVLLACLPALALAWLFHRLVEQPSHQLARRLGSIP
jgi:peptidoglycan/LPS O-acetylase OafA/YrhL